MGRHLDLLLETEIIEPVTNTNPQRYRFNADSSVSKALVQLDGTMNAAGVDVSE